jgi:hypothetical protein
MVKGGDTNVPSGLRQLLKSTSFASHSPVWLIILKPALRVEVAGRLSSTLRVLVQVVVELKFTTPSSHLFSTQM